MLPPPPYPAPDWPVSFGKPVVNFLMDNVERALLTMGGATSLVVRSAIRKQAVGVGQHMTLVLGLGHCQLVSLPALPCPHY